MAMMDDENKEAFGGLIPKWAEQHSRRALEIAEEAAADFKRLVDHLTKEDEEPIDEE